MAPEICYVCYVTGVTKFPFGQVSVKLILDIPEIQVVVINFQNKLPRKAI